MEGAARSPSQALAFFGGLSPSAIVLGLDRVQQALAALGHPERAYRVLHVAGTNGKGSTCAMAACCLEQQGFRVGLYTSPHLCRVNERFCVDGEAISDALLGLRIQEVLERFPEAAADPPLLTFFELGTVVALWHFFREGVEVAVLETGLGGRLDATNAVLASVSAITPISFDHQEHLGDTLEEIAAEKAGVIKPLVPVVVGPQPLAVQGVLQAAAARAGAPLWRWGEDFLLEPSPGEQTFVYRGRSVQVDRLRLGLRGAHQVQNAAVALASLELLGELGLKVDPENLRKGLAKARWPGRLEELPGTPPVLLDGAHNPAGAQALRQALDELYPGRALHLVFGALRDKDSLPMLQALAPRCQSIHLTQVTHPRALDPRALAQQAAELCPEVTVHASPKDALEGARHRARPAGMVVCSGSLFLVGELRLLAGRGFGP